MTLRSLTLISEEIRSGRQSALTHLEKCLERITLLNPKLNALAHVESQRNLERARQIDALSPGANRHGSLLGATFSTRLSINVAGLPLSNGSTSTQPTISEDSATVIKRVQAEGALCLGKGNIAERGKSYFTDNPRYGRTNHFLNQALSPGGSGGGDAVAVATGMVDFAIGADAGGSIRVPASFCGLYGLSATHGVLSEGGLEHQTTAVMRLLKSLGILTRTLGDLERVFTVITGFDAHDPVSSSYQLPPLTGAARIRVCDQLNGVTVAEPIQQAINLACERFLAVGCTIDRSPLPLLDTLVEPFVILAAQAQLLLEDTLLIGNQQPLALDQEGAHLKALRTRLTSELPLLGADQLLYRWHQIDQARNQIAQLFDQFDFLLLPVSATQAPAHNTSRFSVNSRELRTEEVFQFSTVINALALPAIAVPGEFPANSLPTGFQLAAARFGERRLFDLLRSAGYQ